MVQMGRLIQSGRRAGLLVLVISCIGLVQAQSTPVVCAVSSVPPIVRAEGLAERVGDIVLNCPGGSTAAVISGNLTIFLSVTITDRLAANNTTSVQLTIDTGAGSVPASVSATLLAPNAVAFNGLTFTVPAGSNTTLRITNLLANASQLGLPEQRPITAFLGFNGSTNFVVPNSAFTVALTKRGLLATFSSTGVRCAGSPLPATINLLNLFAAGTRFFPTRATEGFASAFQKKDTASDSGTRIIVGYSGFPAGARLFVPDVVVGSSGLQPTAGGDLGLRPSGGQYAPGGAGSLLLARVLGTDPNGAGGAPVYTPGAAGSGTVSFNSAGEVGLLNGSGIAVYEVMDSNPALQESAQFPTFLGLAGTGGISVVAGQSISLAPVSTVAQASAGDPIPRFAPIPPASDCGFLQDCNAAYFPALLVSPATLTFSATAGSSYQVSYVRINNTGGGLLNWTATVSYQSGAGWLTIDSPSAVNNATLRVDVHPEKLGPGNYQATILVDAGPLAGSRTINVATTVTPSAAPAQSPIVVSSVVNAATLQEGPVAPGSLATLKGARLSGKSVAVNIDGLPASLLYVSDSQINLQVPSALGRKTSAQLIVTVDGVDSVPFAVSLTQLAPAIFNNGILNQDNSPNSSSNSAAAGTVVQIFATGWDRAPNTAVTARIGDRAVESLLYAGPAPGLIGVQQINFAIPSGLPVTTPDLRVCVNSVCSPPAKLSLR